MLYNKDWNKPKSELKKPELKKPELKKLEPRRSDPFSLDSLIAWLETKAPYIQYDYTSNSECLLASYFSAQGFKNVIVTPYDIHYNGKTSAISPILDRIAQSYPRTYGSALARAIKLGQLHEAF